MFCCGDFILLDVQRHVYILSSLFYEIYGTLSAPKVWKEIYKCKMDDEKNRLKRKALICARSFELIKIKYGFIQHDKVWIKRLRFFACQ